MGNEGDAPWEERVEGSGCRKGLPRSWNESNVAESEGQEVACLGEGVKVGRRHPRNMWSEVRPIAWAATVIQGSK